MNIPYNELLTMHVPVLVMMLESQQQIGAPKGKRRSAPRVRKATQADIDAFLAS